MSVTECNFIGAEADEDVEGYATYTATYELKTNAVTDGPFTVRQHAALPKNGDPFENGPGGEVDESALVVGRKISLKDIENTRKLWRAVLKYTNNPGGLPARDPGDPTLLPWNEPADIELYSAKDKESYLYDLDGNLIASSAGEPYDPVQERDLTKYMLRIAYNTQFVDPYTYSYYTDAINTDAFFGCDPYTVKVETPGAIKKLWFGTIAYYNVTWEFSIDPKGYRQKLYDYGMYRKVGSGATAKLEVLRDLHGHPITAPRLLNGSGAINPIGTAPVYIKPDPTGDPTRDWFRKYRERPFSVLNLPQTL